MKAIVLSVLASVLLLGSSLPVQAEEPDWANLEPELVLKAIADFEADPGGTNSAGNLAVIVNFAEASSDVQIVLDEATLPWLVRKPETKGENILLGAFVAGNIRPQLEKKVNQDCPVDGLLFLGRVYRALRPGGTVGVVPELEKWSKLDRAALTRLVAEKRGENSPIASKAEPAERKDPAPAAAPAAGANAYRHAATGIVLPDLMATLQKEEGVTDFEPRLPGGGIGVGYDGPGITVTVYIYTANHKSIPDSLQSALIKEHFKQVENDIVQQGVRGAYTNVKKLSQDVIAWGSDGTGPKSLHSSFSFAQGGSDRLSHLFLLAYRDHFLKVRFTYDREVQPEAEKILKNFLAEFGKMLGN